MRYFYEFKKKRVRAYLAGKVCGGLPRELTEEIFLVRREAGFEFLGCAA